VKIFDFAVSEADSYKKSKKELIKRFRHIDEDIKEFLLSVDNPMIWAFH